MPMNKDLVEFISNDTPKFNPDLANGLIVKHMQVAEDYLDSVCRAVLKDLENIGFYYLGFDRVSPAEEYAEITKGKNNGPRQYNLARTDTYMVKMKFKYLDQTYEKLISLPYVNQAGMIHVFGTNYAITPVLADRVISITPPKIFVRLMSVRLNFEKENYHFLMDGIRQIYPVVKSEVYKAKQNNKSTRKFIPVTPMVFYLFAKYGLTETFKRFMDTDVIYGVYGDDITEEKYPEKDYVICRSVGIKPKGLRVKDYIPCVLAFVIPREKFTQTMKCIMAGLFFILDQFTEEFDVKAIDDTTTWKISLGMVLFNQDVNPGKLIMDIDDHLSSVDQYIDEIMKIKFKRIGMNIEDMYQLFYIIIDKFEDWINSFMNKESELYGKELSILYYVLSDLTKQMVTFSYHVKKKNKFNNIKESDVRDAVRNKLRTDAVNNIRTGHGEINVVNYSGDNMIFGMTQQLIPQEKTSKNRRTEQNINLDDATKRLHTSMAEMRTYNSMAKAAPDGSTKINLHLAVDENGVTHRNPELQPMLEKVQKMIDRS